MVTKGLKLNPAELQKYTQFEQSIAHWSIEHTKSLLQTQRLLNAVNSMYEGRMQFMNGVLKAANIDPAHVHEIAVNQDGTATVMYDETVPNPAADPSESSAVSPAAPPAEPSLRVVK